MPIVSCSSHQTRPLTVQRTNAIADDAERAELEEANAGLVNEKRKLEGKCKELAMMVERQEKGRQKLLTEVRRDPGVQLRYETPDAVSHQAIDAHSALSLSLIYVSFS